MSCDSEFSNEGSYSFAANESLAAGLRGLEMQRGDRGFIITSPLRNLLQI